MIDTSPAALNATACDAASYTAAVLASLDNPRATVSVDPDTRHLLEGAAHALCAISRDAGEHRQAARVAGRRS